MKMKQHLAKWHAWTLHGTNHKFMKFMEFTLYGVKRLIPGNCCM